MKMAAKLGKAFVKPKKDGQLRLVDIAVDEQQEEKMKQAVINDEGHDDFLAQVKKQRAKHADDIYQKLIDLENPEDEHRIQKDVTRTFTNYPVPSGEEEEKDQSWNTKKAEDQLFNILLAYANYDTQVGYV